jgi:hypothetical protein
LLNQNKPNLWSEQRAHRLAEGQTLHAAQPSKMNSGCATLLPQNRLAPIDPFDREAGKVAQPQKDYCRIVIV